MIFPSEITIKFASTLYCSVSSNFLTNTFSLSSPYRQCLLLAFGCVEHCIITVDMESYTSHGAREGLLITVSFRFLVSLRYDIQRANLFQFEDQKDPPS